MRGRRESVPVMAEKSPGTEGAITSKSQCQARGAKQARSRVNGKQQIESPLFSQAGLRGKKTA